MEWRTYSNYTIAPQDKAAINKQLDFLKQYFEQVDEIPLIDIVLSYGSNPSSCQCSVAMILNDTSLHVSIEHTLPDQAIEIAFDLIDAQLVQYEAAQLNRKQLLKERDTFRF
jgi:ribosome-associated translation inhibitor RaiA